MGHNTEVCAVNCLQCCFLVRRGVVSLILCCIMTWHILPLRLPKKAPSATPHRSDPKPHATSHSHTTLLPLSSHPALPKVSHCASRCNMPEHKVSTATQLCASVMHLSSAKSKCNAIVACTKPRQTILRQLSMHALLCCAGNTNAHEFCLLQGHTSYAYSNNKN